MTGHAALPAALMAALQGPVVPGASCLGIAPEWDREIVGEGPSARHARHMLARRVCRRCPGLARCLELLDELGADAHDVVLAGEVRDSHGAVIMPRWRLADAIDPDGARGRPDRGAGDHGHRAADPTHSADLHDAVLDPGRPS